MSKGGDKAKPSEAERALAQISAERFNHYIANYRGPELQFIEQSVVSAGKKEMAQGAAAGSIERELGGLTKQVAQVQGAAGARANSGRQKFGAAEIAEIRGTGRGDAVAGTGQAADDETLAAKVRISAFGQNLADNTQLSMTRAAQRGAEKAISRAEAKAIQTASLFSALGTVAGAYTFKEGGIYDKIQERRQERLQAGQISTFVQNVQQAGRLPF